MCDRDECLEARASISRRFLLAAGAGAALAGAGLGGRPRSARADSLAAVRPNAIAPDEALRRLVDGNARYAVNTARNKDLLASRAAQAAGQYPIAGIVSCADSRVVPELAFDQGPGELFVVRLAGNFVDDYGLASLEYGVASLGVPLIVVLGHSSCGAIAATLKVLKENAVLPGQLPKLVDALKPAVAAAQARNPADPLDEAIAENVRVNVRRLQEATPVVAEAVQSGRVKIVGGVYDIASGKVAMLQA